MTPRTAPRRLAAATLVATLVPVGALGLASTADAATASRITVTTSDSSVSSGEQFVLSGRLSTPGVVRVQTREGSTWKAVNGAVVDTRSDGTYRVRVVLGHTGDRTLRVVGDPTAAGVSNSQAWIHVLVS
ncbi:hypothetical protein [Nocardioides plantarum]|uniref:Bacterial Ig domain-containing protein n=1 Tax=Nocardioides plantarum TaxID=29299 RepID=A0ABV5K870_9ACTN|nr:hypothetical protein [Nocardioides plantarum]